MTDFTPASSGSSAPLYADGDTPPPPEGGSMYFHRAGVWKFSTPYILVGGAWKKATGYVLQSGAWVKGIE